MKRNIALCRKIVISQNGTSARWSCVEQYGVEIRHDAGRSPLGAPPWRFWASGPRFRLLGRPPSYNGGQLPSDPCSELLAARS